MIHVLLKRLPQRGLIIKPHSFVDLLIQPQAFGCYSFESAWLSVMNIKVAAVLVLSGSDTGGSNVKNC